MADENQNSGDRNSGDWNSGNRNSGDLNSGYLNSGYRNSGDRNSGDLNSGDRNSGGWNSGDHHTGNFNTTDADGGYFFNTWLTFEKWEDAAKPDWIFKPSPTTWVSDVEMTDGEKVEYSDFHITGGFLRKNDMAKEWESAYKSATPKDIQAVRDLPNFDAAVFLEITGLDLRDDKTCGGKTVLIDGVEYTLVPK